MHSRALRFYYSVVKNRDCYLLVRSGHNFMTAGFLPMAPIQSREPANLYVLPFRQPFPRRSPSIIHQWTWLSSGRFGLPENIPVRVKAATIGRLVLTTLCFVAVALDCIKTERHVNTFFAYLCNRVNDLMALQVIAYSYPGLSGYILTVQKLKSHAILIPKLTTTPNVIV